MAAKLRVTLRKGLVTTTQQARGTVRALGLHRIGQTVELPDSPASRGMVRAVAYLLDSEVVADDGGTADEGANASSTPRRRRSTAPSGKATP